MLKDEILNILHTYSFSEAYVLVYFSDRVSLGLYKDGILNFATENEDLQLVEYCYDDLLCREVHIFSKEKEVRWSCVSSMWSLIEDSNEVFEEKMFIIGNKIVVKNGCSKLSQYGREFLVPFEIESAKKNPLRLVVHHLFDEKNGVISGYRLVDIEGGSL